MKIKPSVGVADYNKETESFVNNEKVYSTIIIV